MGVMRTVLACGKQAGASGAAAGLREAACGPGGLGDRRRTLGATSGEAPQGGQDRHRSCPGRCFEAIGPPPCQEMATSSV